MPLTVAMRRFRIACFFDERCDLALEIFGFPALNHWQLQSIRDVLVIVHLHRCWGTASRLPLVQGRLPKPLLLLAQPHLLPTASTHSSAVARISIFVQCSLEDINQSPELPGYAFRGTRSPFRHHVVQQPQILNQPPDRRPPDFRQGRSAIQLA